MSINPTSFSARCGHSRQPLRALGVISLALWLAACAAPPPPPPPRLAAPTAAVAFDAAIDFAVDDLLSQAQRLPDFKPPEKSMVDAMLQKDKPVLRPKFVVDVSVDSQSAQQTAATRFLDTRLLSRAQAKFPQFEVMALPASLQAAKVLTNERYLLAATLSPMAQASTDTSASAQTRYRINLSLTDLRSGFVLAQAGANATASGVDATPTSFYQDSPSLVRDRIVEGQIRTAQAKAGAEADTVYVSSLTVSAMISEGARLYDAGQFDEARRVYEAAVTRPDGKQLRVFNGLYLTNKQLGRLEAAEQAFGNIVALGLSTNSLSFKFLFKPATTDFMADPKITAPYEMWLRVLAKEIANSSHCMTVLGHSSHTGSEQFNERLSTSRAAAMQRKLETLAPVLNGRLQSVGMGFRENLIGSGTDDLSDALDRRVEFRVRNCQ